MDVFTSTSLPTKDETGMMTQNSCTPKACRFEAQFRFSALNLVFKLFRI